MRTGILGLTIFVIDIVGDAFFTDNLLLLHQSFFRNLPIYRIVEERKSNSPFITKISSDVLSFLIGLWQWTLYSISGTCTCTHTSQQLGHISQLKQRYKSALHWWEYPFKDRLFFRGKLDETSGTNLPINVKQSTAFSKFRSLIIVILLIVNLYTVHNYLLVNQ